MMTPSDFAVLRLITNWNLAGCSTSRPVTSFGSTWLASTGGATTFSSRVLAMTSEGCHRVRGDRTGQDAQLSPKQPIDRVQEAMTRLREAAAAVPPRQRPHHPARRSDRLHARRAAGRARSADGSRQSFIAVSLAGEVRPCPYVEERNISRA